MVKLLLLLMMMVAYIGAEREKMKRRNEKRNDARRSGEKKGKLSSRVRCRRRQHVTHYDFGVKKCVQKMRAREAFMYDERECGYVEQR